MKQDEKEFRLTILVAQYLERMKRPGVFWTHVPSGENRTRETGARLKRMGLRRGLADFLLLVRGVPLFLELKLANDPRFGTKKTYQSPEQKQCEADWEAAGGIYEVAHGFDDARTILERWGAVKDDKSIVRAA